MLGMDLLLKKKIEIAFNTIKTKLISHMKQKIFQTRELQYGWKYKVIFDEFDINDLELKITNLTYLENDSMVFSSKEYFMDFMIFGNVAMNIILEIESISHENPQKLITNMVMDRLFLGAKMNLDYLEKGFDDYQIKASFINNTINAEFHVSEDFSEHFVHFLGTQFESWFQYIVQQSLQAYDQNNPLIVNSRI